MATFDTDDTLHSYFGRLHQRIQEREAVETQLLQIETLSQAAENHFVRFGEARRRYQVAINLQDDTSIAFERRVMLILMLEVIDHLCMGINLIDFEKLQLESAKDGLGLAGESALVVSRVLEQLNQYAGRVLRSEEELSFTADFSAAVDEKRGITFVGRPHWSDFVPGFTTKSFNGYFTQAQAALREKLATSPNFWTHQTISQYLERKEYTPLLKLYSRLLDADFPVSFTAA